MRAVAGWKYITRTKTRFRPLHQYHFAPEDVGSLFDNTAANGDSPIMTHPEYNNYLRERTQHYEKLSAIAYGILKDVPFLIANKTNGAFYNTVIFNESVLNDRQTLPINSRRLGIMWKADKRYYRIRQAICLLSAGGHRYLRGAADVVFHATARFPHDPPG